jgi:subtilase family serine protease
MARQRVLLAVAAGIVIVGAVIVLTMANGGAIHPKKSATGLTTSTTTTAPTTTTTTTAATTTQPPVPAALLHPPTPANTPAIAALIQRACHRVPVTRTCYSPGQLQTAFDLLPLYRAGITGRGVTIGIVDSFGSPTIRQDLAHFDAIFHLPPPPRFRIIEVAGTVSPFTPRQKDRPGWAFETTLDVEWAHALAPGASITLAVTPVDETEGLTGLPQMVASEEYMIRHHLADVISQSFAATEQTFPSAASILGIRGAVLAAKGAGVTMVASSGDQGPTAPETDTHTMYPIHVVEWPASDPLVTAVGGLHLALDAAGGRIVPDSVWNDSALGSGPQASGGGTSVVFARPTFQDGVQAIVGSHRGIPDISMLAASSSPAAIYSSFLGNGGITGASGTSLAAPQFAAIVALADQLAGHRLGWIDPALYGLASHHAAGIVGVAHGDTTVTVAGTGKITGFAAVAGYNLATGLGTVDAAEFVRELAGRGLP